MSIKLFAGLAVALASFSAPASNDAIDFSGSVQRDSAPATSFDLVLPAGQKSKLTLPDGSVLEFSAAASHGAPAKSIVRLLDPSGKQLHSATRPGNAPADKSFRYLICNGNVTYMSPAPKAESSCPQT